MAEEITTQVEGTTETAESMDDYKREVEASFRKLSEGDCNCCYGRRSDTGFKVLCIWYY